MAAAQEATPTFSVLMRPNHEGDTICGAGEVVVREVVEENEAAITTRGEEVAEELLSFSCCCLW